MRSSKSRSRNKSNRQRTLGNIVNRVFDSSGPEGKVRGTPQQIIDKYLTLARDAQLSNDRVAEQSFLQHAEHYTRMLGEALREQAERQGQNQQGQGGYQRQNGDDDRDGGYGNGNGNGNGQHQGQNPNQNQGRGGQQQPYGGQQQNRAEQPQPRHDDAGSDVHAGTASDADERPEFPRFLTQNPPRDEAPQPRSEGLPDAVTASDERDNNLVETPESQPKPKRPRAPRGEAAANRGEGAPARSPAPRRPRKPKADAEVAAAPAPPSEQA